MKTVKIGKHTVDFYSSIKEMKVKRHNLLQQILLQESGIGSTMADVDKHFKTLDGLLNAEHIQDAIIERSNLQLALYSALNAIDYKSLSFACLVHSIDGKESDIKTEDDLKKVIEKLDGLTVGDVVDLLDELKKNCISN